jgi:hypothetical protein
MTHQVTFDSHIIPNCRPITETPFSKVTVTELLEGGLSIQESGVVNLKWKFEMSSETRADLTDLYLTVGQKTLVIDGTTYTNCVIVERGDIVWNHMASEFEGSVTIAQDTST